MQLKAEDALVTLLAMIVAPLCLVALYIVHAAEWLYDEISARVIYRQLRSFCDHYDEERP